MDDNDLTMGSQRDAFDKGATEEEKKKVSDLKLKAEVMQSLLTILDTMTVIYTYPPSEVIAELYSALEELEGNLSS